METETIVAVYDTPAHARLAAADLEEAGVPETAITLFNEGTEPAVRVDGFWAGLLGMDAGHDPAVYDHSLSNGAVVLSVLVPPEHADRVADLLESHGPVDVDERADTLGVRVADEAVGANRGSSRIRRFPSPVPPMGMM